MTVFIRHVHFTLRLWQNGPLHHSYCCKGEAKLSLLYLSWFSGSLLWFSLGRKGAAVTMESKAEKVIVFFRPGMFKMVLVLALLRTLVFFFLCLSLDTPSPFFLVCLHFFLFGAIASYIMDIIQGLTNKGSLPPWAGLGHKHTDHVVTVI